MRCLLRAYAAMLSVLLVPLLPAEAAIMVGGATQQYLSIVTDGTSNTISFGEGAAPARITFCFDNVSSGTISDGTSNTIVFGEGVQLQITGGSPGPRQPINAIADGTSNTILFGDYTTTDFCIADVAVAPTLITDGTSNTILIGENSHFDACFDNVRRGAGSITDGTSNTIVFGESETNACYYGAVVSTRAASIPEAASLAFLAFGIGGLAMLRRRKRTRP